MLIVIPATAQHKPVVEISVARLRKSSPNANILIVCPNPEVFLSLSDGNVRIASDDEFAVVNKTELKAILSTSKRHLVGWYYQQFLKYAIVASLSDSRVFILDADTVVLCDIEIGSVAFFTSKERHDDYFDHFQVLFNTTPPFKASAITNFMWFNTKALRSMLLEISERHQKVWWRVIIDIANDIAANGAFSEYETYANWFSRNHGSHTEIPIHVFRRGDLLLDSKKDYIRVIDKVEAKGYDAVAFELHHSTGFIRKLGAMLFLKLAIKRW
jgi:Family of unknown function (DUF6492)